MHNKLRSCSALCVTVLFGLAVPAGATTIFHETFDAEAGSGEGGSGQSGTDYTAFSNWTVTGGTVDLIAHGDFAPAAGEIGCYGDAGKCVDLDGTNSGGVLTSIVLVLAPGTYELSYQLAGVASSFGQSASNPDNSVEASVTGGLFSETVTRAKGDPWEAFGGQFTVPASMPVQIVFHDPASDSFGAMLDEVRLEQLPEPAAAGLVAGALAVLAVARRR